MNHLLFLEYNYDYEQFVATANINSVGFGFVATVNGVSCGLCPRFVALSSFGFGVVATINGVGCGSVELRCGSLIFGVDCVLGCHDSG